VQQLREVRDRQGTPGLRRFGAPVGLSLHRVRGDSHSVAEARADKYE
jgi:hypothetical protein